MIGTPTIRESDIIRDYILTKMGLQILFSSATFSRRYLDLSHPFAYSNNQLFCGQICCISGQMCYSLLRLNKASSSLASLSLHHENHFCHYLEYAFSSFFSFDLSTLSS